MKKISDSIYGCFEIQAALRLARSFLVLFYASFSLYAADGTRFWKNIGPEGAQINHFITSQDHPEIIYAFHQYDYSKTIQRYLKSSNGGKSWVPLAKEFYPMKGLAVDSVNPHILFCSNSGNLLKSIDNGTHWQQLGGDLSIDASSFFPLNPDVTQSLRVLTFTNNKYGGEYIMAISHDGGEQWRKTGARVDLYNEGSFNITIEASDPKNPKILYGVYTETAWQLPISQTLYKSIDEGLSWTHITGPEPRYGGNLVISPHNSEKLYASFSGVMMVSYDGGKNWDNLGNVRENIVDYRITRVYIDPTDPHILYANLKESNGGWDASQSLAKSYNSGKSWQVIDTFPYSAGEIIINAKNNKKLLMAYGNGVLRSENGGIDWVPSNSGIKLLAGSLSILEGNNTTVMYLVHRLYGLYGYHYKSTDGGQNWQVFRTDGPVRACNKILINPVHNQEIICQTRNILFMSKDSGISWETIKVEASGDGELKAVYAQDGKTIYAHIENNTGLSVDISKSTDNGLSWQKITNIINESDLGMPASGPEVLRFFGLPTIDPRNPSVIYMNVMGDNNPVSLYKSIDGGDSWQFLIKEAKKGSRRLIIHPLNPERLIFSIGQRSYWLSENGGDSWIKTLESLTKSDVRQEAEIEFDPDNLDGLFWLNQGTVYHSVDRGETWDVVNRGLESDAVSLMTSSKSVIVSTYDAGIFKLSEKTSFSDFSEISDCLFQWAENEYPDFFNSDSNASQQWGGYIFRYYKKSNIYLGFFHEQEVHINWGNLSNNISEVDVVGSIEFYQNLADCH